ncbi:MAG: NACHT domain-containing protein, partial [Acidobacteriota bacterium]
DLQANLRAQVGEHWNVRWHDPAGDHGLPEVPESASWGIVVVSPEALADRQLLAMWKGALCQGREAGRRKLLALSVAPTVEWPSWLTERFERIDVRPDAYRLDLSQIISKWIGATEGLADALDLGGELPSPPRLDPKVHARVVDWLRPVMARSILRRLLATALTLDSRKTLDEFPTPELQASAAIVLSRQDDDPVRAALRLMGVVRDELEDEESADRLAELDALADDLRAAHAPATVDRGLLATWLRRVRDDHERLVDYFQRRHELDLLDRIYVELEMSPDRQSGGRAETAEKGRALDGRPRSIEDVLALDPDDHDGVTRRWVVRGDPGSGKTTLLRHLAAKLAADASRRWVPVFQSLPVLLRSGRELLDRLERQMVAQTGKAGLGAVLDREGQEGRLLLLLDGLDEVGELRDEAEGLLRRLADRWPATPIVVSTRPIGYRRFSQDFRDLQLLPLDGPRRFEFLANWFGRAEGERDEERARTAMRQLGGAGFDELAGNPLYLTLMAMLLEQGTAPDQNRSALYDQVFD